MSASPTPLGWPAGDPNAAVREILRDPAYASVGTTAKPPDDPWKPVREWLQDHVGTPLTHWFDQLFRALDKGRGVGEVLGVGLDILIVAIVAILVVRTALAFTRHRRAGVVLGAPLVDRAGSVTDWRTRAADFAARGDYAAAIAALFRASLAGLDARAVVLFDGARTPGEYRRLVRRVRPQCSPPFDELAEGFVRATYAPDPPEREDYDRAERALSAFEPALAP